MTMADNQFGSFDFLSSTVKNKIQEIIEFLDSKEEVYSIYYGYPVIDENNKKEYVKGILITNSKIILLYENSNEEKVYGSSLMNHLTADKDLFKITSNYSQFVSSLNLTEFDYSKLEEILNEEKIITSEDIRKINRAIQVAFNLTSNDNRDYTSEDTLGYQLRKRNTFIGNYDSTQFNMVHSEINSHQRIRGLAGSGKTILMLKKLAFLHFNNKHLNLAFVFYTTSLKQSATKMFKEFYKDYDRYGNPDMGKVSIFHAWGGAKRKGFYSELCERNNTSFLNLNEARKNSENKDPFEFACSELLKDMIKKDFKGEYDFIFVDEAQDFGIDFFNLCLASLRKTDLMTTDIPTGYLVYAYDELQSLREETRIPSKTTIFGDESLCADINLSTCYRTPVEILTSAHALGLGVYRKVVTPDEHPLVNLVDEQTLIDTGYKNLSGTFNDGEEVILERKEEKNGILVNEPESYKTEDEQYEAVAEKIVYLLTEQDVLPNDIMIIDLDSQYIKLDYSNFSKIFNNKLMGYKEKEIIARINLVDNNNPVRVSMKDSISFTTIYRAKGNEANLVFILNSNKISLSSRNSSGRNQIFTAMTRAKWQVWLYGENMSEYSAELEQVRNNNYQLIFDYPTALQRETIKKLGDSEEEVETIVSSTESLLDELPFELVEALLKKRLEKGK